MANHYIYHRSPHQEDISWYITELYHQVSDPYPGSVSDKEVVAKSGVLNQMVTGDGLLVDKGFLIQDMCQPGKNYVMLVHSIEFTAELVNLPS